MTELCTQTVYFEQPGRANTERTLELAYARAKELGLRTALVATTFGDTGARAVEVLEGMEVIAVSHEAGHSAPNTQVLTPENRAAIESAGGQILTCQHAFAGVNRAVRKKPRHVPTGRDHCPHLAHVRPGNEGGYRDRAHGRRRGPGTYRHAGDVYCR